MNNERYQKRTGILGGTFNPIHIGHLTLAQNALEHCGLDEVLFIPSGVSYLKDPQTIADKKHRVNMTRLAIEDNGRFLLSLIETEREGNSYTYETLDTLTKENPSVRYFYIVGADTLLYMENWKHPELIFDRCTVVCAKREGKSDDILYDKAAFLKEKYKADVMIMDVPEIASSSSMIRQMLSEGRSCRYYLSDNVREYITVNHLYGI